VSVAGPVAKNTVASTSGHAPTKKVLVRSVAEDVPLDAVAGLCGVTPVERPAAVVEGGGR
jgi:hypothetical protein